MIHSGVLRGKAINIRLNYKVLVKANVKMSLMSRPQDAYKKCYLTNNPVFEVGTSL